MAGYYTWETSDMGDITAEQLVEEMVGHAVEDLVWPRYRLERYEDLIQQYIRQGGGSVLLLDSFRDQGTARIGEPGAAVRTGPARTPTTIA